MSALNRKIKSRRSPGPRQNWRKALAGELKKAERLFILGIGNRQKADDGAGSVCVRLLQHAVKKRIMQRQTPISRKLDLDMKKMGPSPFDVFPNLRILDAGEVPESATGLIREFHPTHVLIIDAAVGGYKPGAVFLINKKKIGQGELSTHRIPLSYLVKYLEESIRCRVIPLGIEPKEITWRKTVSPAVKISILAFTGELLEILEGQTSILP